jgi:hypothetical protein
MALEILTGMTNMNLMIHAFVILCAIAVSITSFALLIPLDSVPAVTGVSIIMSISYGISFLAWCTVMWFYASKPENLVWLNTHLMFLVVIPATIAATAMNVTSIQNTRNLMAGNV